MAIKGKVFIAGPHDDNTAKSIAAHFTKMLGQEVTLHVCRDDSLIGGFMAIVGDKLYDSSIRSRVENLQHHLFTKE